MTIAMYALIGLVILMVGIWIGTKIADHQVKPLLSNMTGLIENLKASNENHRQLNGMLRDELARIHQDVQIGRN